MQPVLLDAAGHRRSRATMPGYNRGRPPRNKGERYPADPPPVEEIVAVMRSATDRADGQRLRALIVLLWRAGLRVGEALALQESDLDPTRGAILVRRGKGGKRREVGMDRWAWGSARPMAADPARAADRGAALRDPRPDRRPALGGLGSAQAAASRCRSGGGPAAVRSAPATARPCGGDGSRGRSARGDPAAARSRQPRDHQYLPAGHRQRGDH